jgi:hypothetical protein
MRALVCKYENYLCMYMHCVNVCMLLHDIVCHTGCCKSPVTGLRSNWNLVYLSKPGLNHPVTQSPSHPVIQSSSHPITQPPSHPVTQSHLPMVWWRFGQKLMHVCLYLCMYVCMYMYVCMCMMYVCMCSKVTRFVSGRKLPLAKLEGGRFSRLGP